MKRATIPVALLVFAIFFVSTLQAANVNVTYTINPEGTKTPISKYVYGSNWGSGTDYTIRRSGGNRLTAYNWENNYSNAGADWWWNNDNYMSTSEIPGKAITDFHNQALSQGQASIVTLQMAGYVSADKNGFVDCNTQAAPSSRFKKVVFAKGAPFSNPPVTTDANVYMDEFVNFLVSTYGYAGQPNGVKFYDLDNEPDIWYGTAGPWHATHWEVHPYMTNCAEYKNKSVDVSKAVKNVDPNAQMLGPVSYGFGGYLDFSGAPDWASVKGSRPWFISYYLDEMRIASNTPPSKRLLDALDVHWYPEAYDLPPFQSGGHRILDNISTNEMYNARMQAPRTLWDTGYVGTNGENSWINQWFSGYLPLIPRLKSDIQTYYTDTNLAFTEYAYGPETHWSTGIATTDFLGICGKYGVYIATYWGGGNYVDAAIKIYRNYDGSHSTFGDMNVPATMSDKVNSSIYASVPNNQPCELHLIVINKNIDNAISGTFNIPGSIHYTSGRVWKFDNTSANITETTAISTITNNSFTYTVPKTTVCHMVLYADYVWDWSGPDGSSDCHVNIYDLDAFADNWLISDDSLNFLDFASFGLEWRL